MLQVQDQQWFHRLWCHVVIWLSVSHQCAGSGCNSLDGKWYNQLGSEMILQHQDNGQLVGEYRTAVEREPGSAGSTFSRVVGAAPYQKPGSTFGFAVMFSNGSSMAVWTGQCIVCDGEETLLTSWLLRKSVSRCVDRWHATQIGQDVFTRTEQTVGPRQHLDTHTPADGAYQQIDNNIHKERRKRTSPNNLSQYACSLTGYWYNELGSEMILQHQLDNTINGEYRTAVERKPGAAGTSHSSVYGVSNIHSVDSTVAMFVVWRGGESVTGWVGQCQECGDEETEMLGMNWLLRSKVDTCHDNWKATLYGESTYTHSEQRTGPRKEYGIHTPGQEGEDDLNVLEISVPCASCRMASCAKTVLLATVVALVNKICLLNL